MGALLLFNNGNTQNDKSYHKSYLICILQATVSKCENVTVVMTSTAYGGP